MNTSSSIEYVFKTNVRARERLVGNLEKVLEGKIEHVDTSLKNPEFLRDIKNVIITSMQDFKPGEEITMNSYASYLYSREGSKGRILSQKGNEILVDFYYQTGKSPPNQSCKWDVEKAKACKTRFYSMFKELGDYESVAKRMLDKAIEDINLIYTCLDNVIEKLIEKDNVYLVNDNAVLEEIKQDSIYFKKICLEGARKYLRGIGSIGIEKILQEKGYTDCDSAKLAQAESSQALAELSMMEGAKKAGANYVLINQKHILSSDSTIISVIEGLPFMIIGKQEIENLLNKPALGGDVITIIKDFIPLGMIKSNYMGLAKFYPEEFITFFSGIESAEQKKLVIDSLMKMDYDNKEVIAWLDKNESELIREVGLN